MSIAGFSRVIGASAGGLIRNTPWFGDGSDGIAVVAGLAEVPVTEDSGHIFLQYKTLRIKSGGLLKPKARCAGMTILVQGDCTIEAGGEINMDKMAPRLSADTETAIQTTGADAHIIALTQGYTGGNAGNGAGYGSARGGYGGIGFWCGGGYGGGGASYRRRVVSGVWTDQNQDEETVRNGGDSEPRPPITVSWPPINGYGAGGYFGNFPNGEGPGGGGGFRESITEYGYMNGVDSMNGYVITSDKTNATGGMNGDAYGGGALWLVVGGRLSVSGMISACGGNGADGFRGGGGAGGGLIALFSHKAVFVNGIVSAEGGLAGNLASPGNPGTILRGRIALDGTVTIE